MNIDENSLESVFNYKVKTNEEKHLTKVDETLIQYNNLYNSYEYYESKFPDGYDSIPGFNLIISAIVENTKFNNPLKEYNSRINK
jgi:hypothetical protein